MKKLILSLSIGLLIFSCSTFKKTLKTDKSVSDTLTERKVVTRPGDTLTIDIPNIRYKDTTITRVNYENRTVATVRYDSQGNQQFECLSAELREEFEFIKETIKNDIEEKDELERNFNPQYVIYAFAVLILVIVIGFIAFSIMIMKLKKSLPDMVSQIIKQSNN